MFCYPKPLLVDPSSGHPLKAERRVERFESFQLQHNKCVARGKAPTLIKKSKGLHFSKNKSLSGPYKNLLNAWVVFVFLPTCECEAVQISLSKFYSVSVLSATLQCVSVFALLSWRCMRFFDHAFFSISHPSMLGMVWLYFLPCYFLRATAANENIAQSN